MLVPFFTGIGIGSYFLLPEEPNLIALITAVLCLLGTVFFVRRDPFLLFIALAFFWIGAGALHMTLRSYLVAAPVLERSLTPREIKGIVDAVEDRPDKLRVTLRDVSIHGVKPENRPKKIRVSFKEKVALLPGDRIVFTGALMPPPRGNWPGSYNFARSAYYKQIGAVGYVLGQPHYIHPPENEGISRRIEKLRQDLSARIMKRRTGEMTGVAVALLSGIRGSVPEEVSENFRAAGLAHLLSISGLHMALFAGGLFWLIRAVGAAVPKIALDFPLKKIAAFIGLLAAVFYMLLSGGRVPAIRACVMVGTLFLAILLDRRAISFRTIALAALAILLIWPESLLTAGFQLSFAAATALITLGRRQTAREKPLSRFPGSSLLYKVVTLLYTSGLTALIAGIATLPIVLYHFGAPAPWTVIANMLAAPLFAFWVMPMGLLSLLAMPFSAEAPFLFAMETGLSLIANIAAEIASWPGSDLLLPALPLWALLLSILGMCFFVLGERWGRIAAALCILLALSSSRWRPLPDVLIDADSRMAAFRIESDRYLVKGHRNSYVLSIWKEKTGAVFSDKVSDNFCDPEGCLFETPNGRVALSESEVGLIDDCRKNALTVSFLRVKNCPNSRALLSRFMVEKRGGAIAYLRNGKVDVHHVDPPGKRPWSIR